MIHRVYLQDRFWSQFLSDLGETNYRAVIVSPFLSIRRIRSIRYTLSNLARRNVRVCVYVMKPESWNAQDACGEPLAADGRTTLRELIEDLESMNVHVNLRGGMHEKVIVMDDYLLWEGSMNVLSHTNNTERMRRIEDRNEVEQAVAQHRLSDCGQCSKNAERFALGRGLSRQLQIHRELKGLSQRELARRSGTSQSLLSKVEMGSLSISVSAFEKIAFELELEPVLIPRHLALTVAELLRRCETQPPVASQSGRDSAEEVIPLRNQKPMKRDQSDSPAESPPLTAREETSGDSAQESKVD